MCLNNHCHTFFFLCLSTKGDSISANIIVSYEKLFIGTGFWVMPKQCQSMLCKGRAKRANPYLQAPDL